MNNNYIYFSLIVPTIGRTEEVRQLLKSIELSSFNNIEVIIVNQNTDPDICNELNDIFNDFRENNNIDLFHHNVKFTGASRARNYGVQYAKGLWVNFPDDDCELTENLLSEIYAIIQNNNKYDIISVAAKDKKTNDYSIAKFSSDCRVINQYTMWNRFVEFTMFFKKTAFIELNGYDEEFGVGSIYGAEEGADILIKALRNIKPYIVYYDSNLFFFHPEKKDAILSEYQLVSRIYSYSRGVGALLAKWMTLSVILQTTRVILRNLFAIILYLCSKKRNRFNAKIIGCISGFKDYKKNSKRKKNEIYCLCKK
jgi:glycosyltransferase involved in cell wall biosynthesis